MPEERKEYAPFLNGSDLPNDGALIEIIKIRRHVSESPDGFAGYFIDVKSPMGERTISVYFGSVLESMILQKLEGASFSLYPYHKGDKTYISTRKPLSDSKSSSVPPVQQGQQANGSKTRRYGR
jgi:hypothetical protein